MRGKITEFPNNIYFLENDKRYNHQQSKHFSRIMLNDLLIAYERSELHFFLKAPYHSSDIKKWEAYGQTLEYLDKLMRIDNEIAFFSSVSLDSYLIEP